MKTQNLIDISQESLAFLFLFDENPSTLASYNRHNSGA